jgi:hypothetical protein
LKLKEFMAEKPPCDEAYKKGDAWFVDIKDLEQLIKIKLCKLCKINKADRRDRESKNRVKTVCYQCHGKKLVGDLSKILRG